MNIWREIIKKIEYFLPYLVILIISILTFFKIFLTPGLPHHGDLSFPYSLSNFANRFYPLFNEFDSISNFESIDRFFSGFLPAKLFILLNISMETFGTNTGTLLLVSLCTNTFFYNNFR